MDEQQASEKSTPLTLTDADFDKTLADNARIVVDCWAPWCGPCRAIAPLIDELAGVYNGKVTFGKVNVDDNQRIAQKFGIMSIPTLLFIKNGELIEHLVGVVPRKAIEEKIQKLL